MAEIKKFLDQSGVETLWSKILEQDYSSNQTLMTAINAVDEVKADKSELDNYQPKGNYLTEHQKIKTINGQSLTGEGNIMIVGGVSDIRVGSLKDGEYNILAINHRGYSKEAPENTIPAYILSKQKGYNYVECDVSFTSDGVAVLLHDATIDRTSNGSGNISELTYEQVSKYDFGSWFSTKYTGTRIPTFEEFIMYCKGLGLHPYIELKSNDNYTREQIKQLTEIVEAHGMRGKVTYISFSSAFLEYVKECDTKARLGFISDVTDSSLSSALGLKTGENEVFIDCNYTYVNASKVAKCMANDLPLEVWTVNQASVIEGLNPYISGVTSDNQNAGKILSNKYSVYEYSDNLGGDTGGDDTGGDDIETTTYTITNKLTNVTSSNSNTSIEKGESYTANISVPDDYTILKVVITMGDDDITASAYADGVISIADVSGNIVITIVASNGSYEIVRTITEDELSVGVQLNGNSPYVNASTGRTSYTDFDLTYEEGYTYKFDFTTGNDEEYSLGIQWYNETAMNDLASKRGLLSNTYDPGWQSNGVEVTHTDLYKNAPIVAYRLTFKRNSGAKMQSGDITSVIISRKPITE